MAAQKMLNICEKFANENNITFSTNVDPKKSKSKALHFTGHKPTSSPSPVPLILCQKELPWVHRCDHLGHSLTTDCVMTQDCREKRAQFIDSSVKVKEMFGFAHPVEVMSAVEKYCTSWYGCNIWRLDSAAVESLISSWRTCIKLAWNVNRGCRSYLVDHVLVPNIPPLLSSLLSRCHKFFCGLLSNDSHAVTVVARLAARDLRSNLGANLRMMKDISGRDPWCTEELVMKMALRRNCVKEIPKEDFWRVLYLRKLLNLRQQAFYEARDDEVQRISEIIESLVVN